MRRQLSALIAIGLASQAAADPPERSAAETKRLAALLDQGRSLEAHGKHAEAIAAYTSYLATVPDDAVANAELGWAAFQAKDYKHAEAATRLAIAHAPPPTYVNDPAGRPRGAALYNLGQIQEANGAPKDAAVSYAESIAARPSRAALARLQALDPAVAATVDPLAPARLPGPFPSVRDACRDWLVRHQLKTDETWGDDGSCDKPDAIAVRPGKLAAPFEAIVAFELIDRSELEVAVKLHDGWYLMSYPGKQNRGQMHCGGTAFTVKRPTQVGPMLRIEYRSSNDGCSHRSDLWGWDERGTIAIGVGTSGRPSATPPILTSQIEWWQHDDEQTKHRTTDATATIAWGQAGVLDVTGRVTHVPKRALDPDDLDPENLLGHHVIVFP